MTHIMAVVIGFVLDLIFGDPYILCKIISHPVILIGKMISYFEKVLRKCFGSDKFSLRIAGIFLVVLVILVTGSTSFTMLKLCYNFNWHLGFAFETFVCYQVFATKSLKTESMKVHAALSDENMSESRRFLSYIVGRDTQFLNEQGVIKATVETIAENTTDGVISPMIYMCLFGATGGLVYKAINTIDSMVGYKNEKYKYFGTCGAKLDDVANFIPARITAVFMIVASFLLGYNAKNAIKIFIRDRYNHKSPNSAQTESVVAGAFGIELAGDAFYFGELYEKKTIGDKTREVEKEDIVNANKLLYLTSILLMFFFFVIAKTLDNL